MATKKPNTSKTSTKKQEVVVDTKDSLTIKRSNNKKTEKAIVVGDSVLTEENYRKLQSENARLVRNLDDARHAKTVVEQELGTSKDELAETQGKLKKVKRTSRLVLAIAGVVTTVAMTFGIVGTAKGCNPENGPGEYEVPDGYVLITEDEYNDLQQQLANANNKINQLEADKNATEAELAGVRAELDNVKSELVAQQLSNDKLAQDNADLQNEINAANAKIADLLAQIDTANARIDALEAQLSQGDHIVVQPDQPGTGNGNVSVGDTDKEEVNEGTSNKEQDYNDDREPTV